jgi:hypothetical protein
LSLGLLTNAHYEKECFALSKNIAAAMGVLPKFRESAGSRYHTGEKNEDYRVLFPR